MTSQPPMALWKKLLAVAAAFVVTLIVLYIPAELVASWLHRTGRIGEPPSLWVNEVTGPMVFDPVLGHRYSTTPARNARITRGVVEYLGRTVGNRQGFVDTDFSASRSSAKQHRVAVFGDSFTAGSYLHPNWPAFAEQKARESGEDVEFLNLAMDGIGLGNWWSMIHRWPELETYQMDLVVFAAFEAPGAPPATSDLDRTFTFTHQVGHPLHRMGRSESWKSEDWPKTLEEAEPQLQETPGYMVTPEDFDRAIEGTWRPDLPRPWRLYLTGTVRQRLRTFLRGSPTRTTERPDPEAEVLRPEQIPLTDDIAAWLKRRELRALVIRIPSTFALVRKIGPTRQIRQFADRLGAEFIDGGAAFDGLSAQEIREHWLPFDGHWGQRGSDRFGAYVLNIVKERKSARDGSTAN